MSWILRAIDSSALNYSFSALFATVIIILSSIWWRKHIQDYFQTRAKLIKYAEKLPGPPLVPVFGNALELRNPDETLIKLTEIQRRLNVTTYKLWLGPYLKIVITDPRDIEIVMTSTKASEKDIIYDSTRPAAQNSLINSAGAFYRSHKKTLMPIINGHNYLSHYMKEFNKQSRTMVQHLYESYTEEEQEVHEHYVGPCISDIVMETVFGIPGKAQSGEDTEFMDQSEPTLDAIWRRAICVWLWPTIIFKMTECGKLFFANIRRAHEVTDEIILRKKREILMKKETDLDDSKPAILDLMIQHAVKTNTWTHRDIRDELMTLFIASYDTMTGIGSFALLMLAMHPDVQEKLREEIKNVIGDNDIDEAMAAELKYMEMVLRETMRLFPAGPVLGRKVTGDIKLTTCTLPEGCAVLMLPFATQRDPKYWVEPEKFDPERFTSENMKLRHSFSATPFSGGYRSCPGSKYGLHCLKVMIAHIVRNFSLSTTMKMEEIKLRMHISTRSDTGYPIAFKSLIK